VRGAIETSTESELGPDIIEIHCHRCKSHLGNVVEEENEEFTERHRVNGGSIKYVLFDLKKSTTATHHLLS
jgi:peptide methionine sulfoxide reductase MsrB